MKIGFFTNSYLPLPYGSTNSIRIFRHCLEKMGHKVFVFAPKFKGYSDGQDSQGVFRYPAFLWKYKITYPIPFSFFPPAFWKARREKLDIIHSHQPFAIGKDGKRIARKLKIPFVFTYHARYEDYVHYVPLIPRKFLINYVRKTAINFANQADLVIAPSHSIKVFLKEKGVKTRVEIVPTGIEIKRFQKGKRRETREKLAIKEDEKIILNVGRIEKEKNIKLLFEAVKDLLKKNQKLKLVFVGEGSERKKIQKQVFKEGLEKQVIFVGRVRHDVIQDYFSIGDIFLQTSTSETQGLTLIEAMAAGLPVIAVKASGSIDQIKPDQTGILVKNEKESIKQALLELINNPQKIQRLVENGKKEVVNFDQFKNAKKIESLYYELLKLKRK